jgi:hypothetical protein
MNMTSMTNSTDHASLAMDAARRLKRARKQSQKEKMGKVVCHHLLCLLSAEGPEPFRKRLPATETLKAANELDEKQFSLGF